MSCNLIKAEVGEGLIPLNNTMVVPVEQEFNVKLSSLTSFVSNLETHGSLDRQRDRYIPETDS